MKQKAKTSSLHLPTVALALGFLTLAPAIAADLTWTGASSADWSDANWNGGTPVDSGTDTLTFAGSTNLATSNDLTGFTAAGTPAITFASGAGAFSLAGNAISLSGNIVNSSSNLQTINLGLALVSSSTFAAGAGGGNLAIGGPISGSNGITVTGAGMVTLSGSNVYSGTTVLTGVTTTLQVGHNSALGTGAIRLESSVTMQATGADITLANSGLFITPIFSGSQSLTFTGKLTGMTGGNRTITNNITTDKTLTFTNIDISEQASTRTVTFLGSGNTHVVGTIANGTATNGKIEKNGSGVLTFSGSNTYSNTTTINSGRLQFAQKESLYGGNSALWTAPRITVESGATFGFNVGGAGEFTTGDVTTILTNFATSNANGTKAGSTLGFDTTNASGTFTVSDVIADSTGTTGGARGITKLGTGTLSLSGSNTYTGTTTVNAGTLLIDGDQSSASGTVNVAGGATLGGSGTVGGATTIAGIHNPGNSPGLQTFVSDLSYTDGSSVNWELTANSLTTRGEQFDGIDVGGDLSITGTSTINLVFNVDSSVVWANSFWNVDQSWVFYDVVGSTTGTFTLGTVSVDSLGQALLGSRGSFSIGTSGNDVLVNYTAVPEPTILGFMGLAAGAALALRRRVKRN